MWVWFPRKKQKKNTVPTSAFDISLLKQDGASTDSEEEQADFCVGESQTVDCKRDVYVASLPRWWFQIFLFSSLPGEDFQFD